MREIAAEVDRLALAVYVRVGPAHGDRLRTEAARLGLDSLAWIADVGEFVREDALTRAIASLRFVYGDQGRAVVHRLERAGHLTGSEDDLVGSDTMKRVLAAGASALGSEATELWASHAAVVDRLTQLIGTVTGHLDDRWPLARAHAALAVPKDRCAGLHHRLVTLRYVRHDAHRTAWSDAGLTPREMVELSRAVSDDPTLRHDPTALHESQPDLVQSSGAPTPIRLWSEIENGTDERYAASLAVLGEDSRRELLGGLRGLPPEG